LGTPRNLCYSREVSDRSVHSCPAPPHGMFGPVLDPPFGARHTRIHRRRGGASLLVGGEREGRARTIPTVTMALAGSAGAVDCQRSRAQACGTAAKLVDGQAE